MGSKTDILIIGIGNPFRHDDGVGFFVIDALENRGIEAEIKRVKPDGYSLLEAWKDRELVIIIDAARGIGPVGTVRYFNALNDEIDAELSPVSTHSLSLPETLFLGKTLNQLPNDLWIYAIEAGDLGHGTNLSPEVRKAALNVALEIEALILEYPEVYQAADSA
ncbi:MAG: hydrogenase maturation protease [Bacteroidetes bacterium]|jgi:hydrogenase maturation protease|nr:hydrogenase maturation protease [Bacteroidota bacterium]